MALMEPHPALKAASEQASPADMFLGDDFHHNGAFRLSYGFEYVSRMETGKIQSISISINTTPTIGILSQGPLSSSTGNIFTAKSLPGTTSSTILITISSGKDQAVNLILKKTTVPNLNVAGWWDQEDYLRADEDLRDAGKTGCGGSQELRRVGPWRHGGWGGTGSKLGPIEFGGDQSLYYREKIEAPWFAYWLKDKGQLHQPEAMAFETGRNSWESYNAWPPVEGIEQRKLNFAGDSKLSFDPPRDDKASTPTSPIPRIPFRIAISRYSRLMGRDRNGMSGWCRISASSISGPTFWASRPSL